MHKGTVLIIEDTEPILEMAKDLLEREGFQTFATDNVDTGIQLAKTHHPDVILMDMNLPGKDGYEASLELRSDPTTKDIPIVAFTALAMPEEQKKAKASGCRGVISKPFDVNHFTEMVESYIQQPADAKHP